MWDSSWPGYDYYPGYRLIWQDTISKLRFKTLTIYINRQIWRRVSLLYINRQLSHCWLYLSVEQKLWDYKVKVCSLFVLCNPPHNHFNIFHLFNIIFVSHMMSSSNGNIFRVTGHLCGEFTGPRGPREFPTQRPVTRSFDVFFDLRLNKRLNKQWWGWWFETPSHPLWRHCNDLFALYLICWLMKARSLLSHKGEWLGALMFSLICAWINGWVNNGEAGDFKRHRAHYDAIVMGMTMHPLGRRNFQQCCFRLSDWRIE